LGDAVRVDDVALALVAASSTTSGAVRRYVANVEAVVDEELGEVPSEAGGVLDSPPLNAPVIVGPRDCFGVAGDVVVEVLGGDDGAAFIEDGGGEASPRVWFQSRTTSPSSIMTRRGCGCWKTG
jgi:hypothetical protein